MLLSKTARDGKDTLTLALAYVLVYLRYLYRKKFCYVFQTVFWFSLFEHAVAEALTRPLLGSVFASGGPVLETAPLALRDGEERSSPFSEKPLPQPPRYSNPAMPPHTDLPHEV